MSRPRLASSGHPAWTLAGWLLIGGTFGSLVYYAGRGPKIIAPQGDVFSGSPKGVRGTISEELDRGRFLLSYETIEGQETDLHLKGVSGSLQEPEAVWLLASPAAERQEGRWTLGAPLGIEAKNPGGLLTGTGRVEGRGPAVRWTKGLWEGLEPLAWENLEGSGQGKWELPKGWRRGADGHLEVQGGPVRWEPAGNGALRHVEAQGLFAQAGFQEGELKDVVAETADGNVRAEIAELKPDRISWPASLHFQRTDGWIGEAAGGFAPRPGPGQGVERIELRQVQARRPVEGGEERLQSNGARWTKEGLLLEGSVTWDQLLDGLRLQLRAPRMLQREAPGPGLPENLAVGAARAEGTAVLTWGRRSLSSPTIEARSAAPGRLGKATWHLAAPVLGRSEEGTFSAGAASGTPMAWVFAGPVEARLFNGGNLRGSRLVWEEGRAGMPPAWTLSGRPALWTRFRERLSGLRILRRGDHLEFPDGLTGALSATAGELTMRAGRGESDLAAVKLAGRVECLGLGWGLKAERVSIQMGPGRIVKSVRAEGSVVLRGAMGEGRGEALDLDLTGQVARWQGRVKGLAESPSF